MKTTIIKDIHKENMQNCKIINTSFQDLKSKTEPEF